MFPWSLKWNTPDTDAHTAAGALLAFADFNQERPMNSTKVRVQTKQPNTTNRSIVSSSSLHHWKYRSACEVHRSGDLVLSSERRPLEVEAVVSVEETFRCPKRLQFPKTLPSSTNARLNLKCVPTDEINLSIRLLKR